MDKLWNAGQNKSGGKSNKKKKKQENNKGFKAPGMLLTFWSSLDCEDLVNLMETNLGGENYFTYFLSLGFKSKLCAFALFKTLRLYAFKRKRPTLYYLNK